MAQSKTQSPLSPKDSNFHSDFDFGHEPNASMGFGHSDSDYNPFRCRFGSRTKRPLGYSRHEVLGCDCRFLNGPRTDAGVLQQIKDCIRAEQACSVRLLNYRKDGSSFGNLLHISPVRDASGKIAFYVEVQIDENSKSDEYGLSPKMRQHGVVGQVKVAVRCLSSRAGPSRTST